MWNRVPPASQNSSATPSCRQTDKPGPGGSNCAASSVPPQFFHQSLNAFPSQKLKKPAALTIELPLGPFASCLRPSRYDWKRSDNHPHVAFDWPCCRKPLRRLESVRCQQLARADAQNICRRQWPDANQWQSTDPEPLPPVPTRSPEGWSHHKPSTHELLADPLTGPTGGLRDGCEGGLTGSGVNPDATPLRSKTEAGPWALGTRGLGPSQTGHTCWASCTVSSSEDTQGDLFLLNEINSVILFRVWWTPNLWRVKRSLLTTLMDHQNV